jgi:phosphomannomutase/phosphoglucomutase
MSNALSGDLFRAYDIRGIYPQTLTQQGARLIGQAIGSQIREQGENAVVLARDGRLSGPVLLEALAEGLRDSGCSVIDVGMVPTPVLYFATHHYPETRSGVMVTGSHNPPDYNGFKIVINGTTLSGQAIRDLQTRIEQRRFTRGPSERVSRDILPAYLNALQRRHGLARPLRAVVDCGNGVAGVVAPEALMLLGVDVIPLYTRVDGTFPNHHPDPGNPENLNDLIATVAREQADLGLAFDGDGDRLGVVTRDGEIIYPDRLLMLFARDVLTRNPGATIIYDVKCTGHLQGEVLNAGGSPLMWRTGHSLIKAKMRETEALLAGEMSGHFFFRERWFGFDDGIYAAARLLEILAGDLEERTPEDIFATLPKGVSTPELKIPMEEGAHYAFIKKFRDQAQFEGARLTTIDGLRADWKDGWGLVRASNTTPVLVLRFDADDEAALQRIQQVFRVQLLAVDATLELPF